MEEEITHIANITIEACYDYADTLGLLISKDEESFLPSNFSINRVRKEIEDYITFNRRLHFKRYYKLKYILETGEQLYLFIRKGKRKDKQQIWDVVGICNCKDWNEDIEEIGGIKAWLDTKIDKLPKERDWVVEMYSNKILERLEDIYDYGGYDEYIRAREEVARKLSKQYCYDTRNREIEPRRVKSYLKKGYVDSKTANELLGQLDLMLEEARQRADSEGL